MADFPIDDPKTFDDALQQLVTSDSVHIDTLNPMFDQLINNDSYLNEKINTDINNHETAVTGIHGVGTSEIASKQWVNENAKPAEADNADKLENKTLEDIFDLFHPVGSIVHRYDSTDPSNLNGWYGTWTRIAVGKMLIGQDPSDAEFDTVSLTGGEKEHQLTEAEMPSHNHTYTKNNYSSTAGPISGSGYSSSQSTTNTGTTGEDEAHNNMPPYEVVYIWKRTS